MLPEVILYIAISSDGFIADKNGGVGWLDQFDNPELRQELDQKGYGFEKFYETIDAIAMGKTTYEQVLTFGPWHFIGKTSYIFVDKDTPATDKQDIEFVYTDIPQFMQDLSQKKIKRLWLMGGAKLAESFYKAGYIDEYIITIIPIKLGEGISLLPAIVSGQGIELVNEVS